MGQACIASSRGDRPTLALLLATLLSPRSWCSSPMTPPMGTLPTHCHPGRTLRCQRPTRRHGFPGSFRKYRRPPLGSTSRVLFATGMWTSRYRAASSARSRSTCAARSPDLSPIKKVWADCERELWAGYRWTDFASFKVALATAWDANITPVYCKKLFTGLQKTYVVCSAHSGAHVTGWGDTARVKRVSTVGIGLR